MFRKERLDNGIPVVMERVNGVRSVAAGVWVKVGTRFEDPEKNGISHFLEHMFFKGTRHRSQKDIALDIDSLGGDLNAFTSREYTAYYVKILDDFIEEGIDILSDIFLHSLLREEDIEKEKGIIREEIKMTEDTPDDYIHDLFFQDIWGNEGLGMPVLGTKKTVKSFTREDNLHHVKKYYGTRDIVISCAGNIHYERVLSLLNHKLSSLRRGSESTDKKSPVFSPGVRVHKKDLSDVHICIGVEGIKQDTDLRYPFLLLNTILGSGVSSRLFQEVRENRGLVYSIYSFLSSYCDTGLFGVYAATGRRTYLQVIETILHEMKHLRDSLTSQEFDKAKSQLKGNLILALESSSGRMNNIARQQIYFEKYFSPAEIIRGIENVQLKDMNDIIDDYLVTSKVAITLLGPAEKSKVKGLV